MGKVNGPGKIDVTLPVKHGICAVGGGVRRVSLGRICIKGFHFSPVRKSIMGFFY
jgi:hypothetical protein